MTKPSKWMCAQRRLRSAWASAQSDQSLRCALNGLLRTQAFFMQTAKTDQTGRMPRLIWVFAVWIYRFNIRPNLVTLQYMLSRLVTKPTMWLCAQRRLRSAWASTQSDQSLRCPREETLGPQLPSEHKAKILIRLGGCPGWSESSLGAQPHCFVTRRLCL